ncbi:hypothetical protein H072_4521 [Dactylellina haptotyla CBS 200.50]|uniref:DUF4097 domain-containing protein n=1 Tax=Dactylellina haptotyla (strain CBS 200.50) TaxID=1284197 RepID=S8AEU4_DACHA|nr:hypothetical protein H072_4521 [Dactylellina haptotyla CBS 200.50]
MKTDDRIRLGGESPNTGTSYLTMASPKSDFGNHSRRSVRPKFGSMAWFKSRTEDSAAAGSSAGTAGERAALLPNEEYRLARRPRPSRSRLWLLPAITFLLMMSFLTHQCTVWFFGGTYVTKGQTLATQLEYTHRVGFWIEGNGKLEGSLEVLEVGDSEEPKLEVEVFPLTWDTKGFSSVQLENLPTGVALKCERGLERSWFWRTIPRIKVSAKLYLRVEKLRELSISTNTLDLQLNLQNADLLKTVINSKTGNFKSPNPFKSLDTEIRTTEGDISGPFALYDRLRLLTEAGNIDIRAIPQEGTDTATTKLRTSSGDIKVGFEESTISRGFETAIETTSGNVKGDLLLGSNLFVKSESGDIGIHVSGTDSTESFFRTENSSGMTNVKVVGGRMRKVISYHTSESRDVHVSYPSTWEGEIHAKTVSGDIRLEGDGVEVTQELEGLVRGQEIWAEKGNPSNGRLIARATNGDVILSIGR